MSDMRFDYTQKMQQQFRLSTQMIQSIELLRLPVEELCDRIYQEAEKNPAIEIVRDVDLSIRSVSVKGNTRYDNASDSFQAFIENAANPQETLQEHLLFQLNLLDLTEVEQYVGTKIIQNLDEHGFNIENPITLLEENETESTIIKMQKIIHELDPFGTGFDRLEESLEFQAKLMGDVPELVLDILKNHFSVLEKKRPLLIKKKLQDNGVVCTIEQVEDALAFIKALNPYPAYQYTSTNSQVQYVVPEIVVRKQTEIDEDAAEEDSLVIEFLQGAIPEVIISPVYQELISQATPKKDQQFVNESVQNAKAFMQALSYRTKSIYDAVKVIVLKQREFFLKGPGHLVPLRLKDIGEMIGAHEATISRISNGKYLQCAWGIFELKYFFTNSVLQNSDVVNASIGDSKESIKHKLLVLLKEHEKVGGKKLSDAKLTQMLNDEGIEIARRTVAKYRSELNIESSFDRL